MSIAIIILKSLLYTISEVAKVWFKHFEMAFNYIGKVSLVVFIIGTLYACLLSTWSSLVVIFENLRSLIEDITREIHVSELKKKFNEVETKAMERDIPISTPEAMLYVKRELANKIVRNKEVTQEEVESLAIKSSLSGIAYEMDDNAQEEIAYVKPKSKTSPESFATVRKELILNNYKLQGTVLKTTYTNISDEELYKCIAENKPLRSCILQQITFGLHVDVALKEVCPQYKLKRRKGRTYFILDENEVFDIEQDLRRIFMNESISLSLKDVECEK